MNKQSTTNNITIPNKNLEILKKNFSHCFDKNSDFDIEKFRKELSKNEIDFSKESYVMDWLGKSYARLLASDEATTLLKEDEKFNQKQENKDSENLLIKGDNLEVLKHLSNAYYEKIKMIYIDPPYNTGSDGFVYQDDRKFTVKELSTLAGIDEDKAKRILDFTQSKSNSHSAWLSFMYPRLYIAKQLLKDNGVIFISIDDNEVAQLRLLMDEIFGEENFLYNLSVVNSLNGNDNSSGLMETEEYCLIYSKNKDLFEFGVLDVEDEEELKKWNEDEIGFWKKGGSIKASGEDAHRSARENLFFPIFINKNGTDFSLIESNIFSEKLEPKLENGDDGRWTWKKSKFVKDKNEIIISKSKTGFSLYKKQRPSLGDLPSSRGKETFYNPKYSTGTSSTIIKKLFDIKVFQYTKSPYLISDFIKIANTQNNDLILDFFAGSGTTGDAVMKLNSEDGGNRKYILVQLPEKIDPKKNKTAYDFVKNELKIEEPTIFEITKERLIRSAKKIQDEAKDKKIPDQVRNDSGVDFGFKIFETTPIWEDYDFEAEEFDDEQTLFDENSLTDEDIKTLLTTWKTYDGISLTQDLKEINLDGYTGYYFGTKLYLMNKGFKIKNLKKLLTQIDENKEFNPATVIVFGYNFESKVLREIAENIKNYANKKQIDVDFITRY